MRARKLCPCGSGLIGKSQWSQGLADTVCCPKCFTPAPTKTEARTPNPSVVKASQARRRIEELRDVENDPLMS